MSGSLRSPHAGGGAAAMSCHTGRTSPISSTEQSKELGQASGSTTPVAEKSPGLNRALQSLLITPQSKGAGGATHSPRGGTRSPVEPLVSSPLRISSSAMASAPSSPERHTAEPGAIPRRSSDQVVETGRPSTARLGNNDDDAKSNTASNSGENPHAKKRFLQARDRSQGRKGMAAMMSGRLFPRSFSRGRDSSHGSSQRGASLDSRSPPSPERGRPSSSGSHSSHVEDFKPAPASSEKGKAVNIHASLNKSDEALAKPTGDLPDYVKPSFSEQGGERLAKDVFDRDKNMIESSEDEANDTSSDDDSTLEGHRGRKKQKERNDITSITKSDFEKSTDEKAKQPEEQKETADINGSQDKKPRKSALKAVVHPQTSFDIPTPRLHSVAGTPYGSDDEAEIGDIHRAQKLSISLSDIDNGVPHRSIRTIVRGNFSSLQDQGDGSRRRRRKYLVATDLSEESVYALEWTIGTVLRDGDTIYAIYVMHEDSTTTSAVQVGEGAKAMKDARAVVGSQTKEANQSHGSRTILGRLGPGISSKTHSADSRASSMAEAERVRAVESVSQTCVKLLRKTVLQVRIAVEVIHCKNPKSMITEAIDELEPTLVIVGARGQSALKGVLLGSFSNYLLSNSSVPVMVARRRLKRHTWKEKLKGTANVRLSNNLITPKSLAQAKVD